MKKYNRENVYHALIEIYDLTQKPTELAISKIFRKHNLSGTIATVLVKNRVLKVFKTKRPKMYLWNSVKPHYKMVDNVIEKTQELSKFYRENPKKQKLDIPKENDKTIDDNIGYWSKFENANYLYSLAEENTKVKSEEVNQPIEEEKDFLGVDITNVEICDNGTTEKLKQLQKENEKYIYKIGELNQEIFDLKTIILTVGTTSNESLKKKQKDRSIKNFTLLWGMIKINY